jgi:predicted negative regulator of RcsB-dependent stress response
MANHLDLEEQEQLDQLKHFWKQYGNLITWGLIVVLGAVAGWNGYQYWQRSQAAQAAAMYDEVERMARSGDSQKIDRAFLEMKDRFSSTTYAQQAALLVAKVSYERGDVEAAKAALNWVVDKASDKGYSALARLRLSGLLIEAKSYDEALKLLSTNDGPEEFAALIADRRGDIYLAQGKKAEAKVEYQKAYQAFDTRSDYRRLVEVKLNALGVNAETSGTGLPPNAVKTETAQ